MSNIKYELLRSLENKIALGQSKVSAESKNNGQSPYIHSSSTVRSYMQQVGEFGIYLRERGLNKISVEDSKQYAKEFVLSKNSAWSQSLARSALAKVYGCSATEICPIDKRGKEAIVRGRTMTPRAVAIEKNHPDLVDFCKSTGLRNNKELQQITKNNFSFDNDKIILTVVGKCGLVRAINIKPEDREKLRNFYEKYLSDGEKLKVYHGMNVHKYRSDFAKSTYQYALANGYGNGQIYKPHHDGRTFDKGALSYVSNQLGHGSGRYYTVVTNYLYQ